MPRKAKKVDVDKEKPVGVEQDPQPTLTKDEAAAGKEPKAGRGRQGQFVKGNEGGPGNPHARHCARMLTLFRSCITDNEMVELVRNLYAKATAGDLGAVKIVLNYKIGKPAPAPLPDDINRQEWDHFKNDRLEADDLKSVMSSLPTSAALNIVRTALPEITEAFYQQLAAGLMKGMSVSKESEKQPEDKDEKREKEAPIANGNSDDATAGSSMDPTSHCTDAIDPWDFDAMLANWSTQQETTENVEKNQDVPVVENAPIANGKKSKTAHQTAGKNQSTAGPHTESPKREPIANGKKRCGTPSRKRAKALWVQTVAKQLNEAGAET